MRGKVEGKPTGAGRARSTGSDPVRAGLQKLFAPVLDEAVPDAFLRILDQIDAERAQSGNDTSDTGSEAGGDRP